MLKIYNTLTRSLEIFEPLNPPEVKMYVCGVTPYDDCHLGHGRAYVVFDLIRRYLIYKRYQVKYIQNFTDIDDKILKRAAETGENWQTLSKKFQAAYFEMTDRLHILRADFYPKATENIAEMIELIKKLLSQGFAYEVAGDVYFEVRKFSGYGKLSGKNIDDLEAGARVEVDTRKKDPLDFALWKKAKPGEPFWASPWGAGRPGWHIECSAMSQKYLGLPFDIHAGGADLIFPHHENEIAQSEAAFGQPLARYWLHNGFVTINREKMSKSLGNFFTLKDIFEKFPPMVVRLFLLSLHYRSPLDFSDDKLEEAKAAFEKLQITAYLKNLKNFENPKNLASGFPETKNFRTKFNEVMDDDFNSAEALAVIFNLSSKILSFHSKQETGQLFWELLSLFYELCEDILGFKFDDRPFSPEEKKLTNEFEQARETKNYSESDKKRKQLENLGIGVQSMPVGNFYYRKVK